jgi:hypothetical protein
MSAPGRGDDMKGRHTPWWVLTLALTGCSDGALWKEAGTDPSARDADEEPVAEDTAPPAGEGDTGKGHDTPGPNPWDTGWGDPGDSGTPDTDLDDPYDTGDDCAGVPAGTGGCDTGDTSDTGEPCVGEDCDTGEDCVGAAAGTEGCDTGDTGEPCVGEDCDTGDTGDTGEPCVGEDCDTGGGCVGAAAETDACDTGDTGDACAGETCDTDGDPNCTYSQGYWKNHPEAWPLATLEIGPDLYTAAELLDILALPIAGDKSLILARQLIAARLNVAQGADATAIAAALVDAEAWCDANHDGDGLGYGSSDTTASDLGDVLEAFNTGVTGPGHCPDDVPEE